MKLTATIVVSIEAQTVAEAGAKLDAVLAPARADDGVEIDSIDMRTPSAGPRVAPSPTSWPALSEPIGPHPLPGSG